MRSEIFGAEVSILHICLAKNGGLELKSHQHDQFDLTFNRNSSTERPPSVDKEWAKSLIGLHMKGDEGWWEDYGGTALWPGQIVAVNFGDELGRFFILQLNGEEWTYPMSYDAVLFMQMKRMQMFTSVISLIHSLAQLLCHKKDKRRSLQTPMQIQDYSQLDPTDYQHHRS